MSTQIRSLVAVLALILVALVASSCSRMADGATPTNDELAVSNSTAFAQCMRDAGFDFIEEVDKADDEAADSERIVVGNFFDESDRGVVGSVGYGVVSAFREGFGNDSAMLTDNIAVAPNLEIYLQLDAATQRAYDETFARCQSEFPLRPVLNEDEVIAERQAASDRYERLMSDDEFVQALDQWRQCMNDKGFEYANPEDARFAISNRLADVVHYDAEWMPTADPGPFPINPPAELDEAALAQLERDELLLASADLECQIQSNLKEIVARFASSDD